MARMFACRPAKIALTLVVSASSDLLKRHFGKCFRAPRLPSGHSAAWLSPQTSALHEKGRLETRRGFSEPKSFSLVADEDIGIKF